MFEIEEKDKFSMTQKHKKEKLDNSQTDNVAIDFDFFSDNSRFRFSGKHIFSKNPTHLL